MVLPPEAHGLAQVLALHFTNPTYQRFSTLLVGAILTTGRRTVANLLRTLRGLAPGHVTGYRRVLSRAPWSGLALGCSPARFLIEHIIIHLAAQEAPDLLREMQQPERDPELRAQIAEALSG